MKKGDREKWFEYVGSVSKAGRYRAKPDICHLAVSAEPGLRRAVAELPFWARRVWHDVGNISDTLTD